MKPQVLKDVAEALAPYLGAKQLVISIVAGIRAADLSRWLGGYHADRARDAEYARVDRHGRDGAGGAAGRRRRGERRWQSRCWRRSDETVWFDDEAKIDAVTAISGSGPAYVFYFIEAMQEAARQLGMDEAQGRALAVATFTGAAQLAAQSE